MYTPHITHYDLLSSLSRYQFQPKHGTAERWDVCTCGDCLAGKEAAGLLQRPVQLELAFDTTVAGEA